jgi:ATP-binding cassette subfamily F protein uup
MPPLVSVQDLSKQYGPRPLFTGLSLGVHDGERVGLIGANGSGKSTLLKLLAGLEKPDQGAISWRRGLRTAYVGQSDAFPDGETVAGALRAALAEQALDEAEREFQVERMLAAAAFPEPGQAVATLSGGWRKRLALASALIREPDLLLLDEPTNHLDLPGVRWLEATLRDAPFAFVAVSHDRAFLRAVANRVIELGAAFPDGCLTVAGGYDDHVARREETLNAQLQRQQSLTQHVRREVEWLRQTAAARSTKQQARIQRAGAAQGDLADLRFRNSKQVAGIAFDATRRQTRELIRAEGVAARRGGRKLFADLDLLIGPRVKLGIVGPNGSGKTTLLNVLLGSEPPDAGAVRHADGLRVVYFDQDRAALDQRASLREALTLTGGDTVTFQGKPIHVAAWAKRFLFRPELLEMSIAGLSGGEQARILLARLMLQPADVLVLDEPTNDLDIPTLEVLEESLRDFPGAVLLVTHDRALLDNLATHVLGLDGRGNAGLFADRRQWERHELRLQPAAAPTAPPPRPPAAVRRTNPARQRELNRVQERIEKAEARCAELRATLEDPAVATDPARLQAAWQAVEDAEATVGELYARWEELEAETAT